MAGVGGGVGWADWHDYCVEMMPGGPPMVARAYSLSSSQILHQNFQKLPMRMDLHHNIGAARVESKVGWHDYCVDMLLNVADWA